MKGAGLGEDERSPSRPRSGGAGTPDGAHAGVRLSGLVVCKNERRRIGACLDSLAFCDELVVVDSGSTDGTLEEARARGARVFERPWRNVNDQKDFGRSEARGRWVFNLDADEVAPPDLARRVRRIADESTEATAAAYLIPFRNHFRGVWVRRGGYHPDPHVRLLDRARARWDVSQPVHDRVLVDGAVGRVEEHIDHYSFESVAHFLEKSGRYAAAFAVDAFASGRRAGLGTILFHTTGRFLKAYLLKAGFLEGALGLAISGLQAYEVFQKYVRLWELGRFGQSPDPRETTERGPR